MPSSSSSAEPIPVDTALVHIGPHKTGSTAIQDALHQAREELAEQGVRYASAGRHDATAARWVTDRMIKGTDPEQAKQRWRRVVRAMHDETAERRIFSSEFLSDATDPQIRSIMDDFGVGRTTVALTLRPLASILPSQYQQYVQRGTGAPYDEWLDVILRHPEQREVTPSFWVRHRHDHLVRRWADVAGADRVVVIVLDSSDYSVGPRSFEELLALRPGTLAEKEVMANRSFTAGELHLIRGLVEDLKQAGLGDAVRQRLVLQAAREMKARTPQRDEQKIYTPDWAITEANEIASEMVANIEASGVRVVGDLRRLDAARPNSAPPPGEVPVSAAAAARMALGIATAAARIDQDNKVLRDQVRELRAAGKEA